MRERAVRCRYDFVPCSLRSERRPRRVERLVQRFHRLGAPCAEVAKVVVPRRTGADSRRKRVPSGGCECLFVHTNPPRVMERNAWHSDGTSMARRRWQMVALRATQCHSPDHQKDRQRNGSRGALSNGPHRRHCPLPRRPRWRRSRLRLLACGCAAQRSSSRPPGRGPVTARDAMSHRSAATVGRLRETTRRRKTSPWCRTRDAWPR